MIENELCPGDRLQALVEAMGSDMRQATADLELLLGRHPDDPRLHFLKGSLAAGRQEYEAGIRDIRRAVEIAPEFWIARYQLGFLQLTNGEALAAQETWGPMHGLPESHYLRVFVSGLIHMIHDRFPEAIETFERGMLLNDENLPVNADIKLVVDALRERGNEGDAVSSVDLLLRQSMMKATRH